MPRIKTHNKETITKAAMWQFWNHGYFATSMDDLVKVTGASRHAIYSETGGKHSLYLACLDGYKNEIVNPAFRGVEAQNANLQSIKDYFLFQISKAEEIGAPFPGCLMANTMTETGPHDRTVMHIVKSHNKRLELGFLNALKNSNDRDLPDTEIIELSKFTATSAQGLWSFSRSLNDVAPLRSYTKTLMQLLERKIVL